FVYELEMSIPYYNERHRVKPGITGWAQSCYPYGASQQDSINKHEYDLFYVKNHSLLLDVSIMLQTVEVVLFGKGGR
ncbi:MAG: sugar transferase, partial [Sedimenticola sp.]